MISNFQQPQLDITSALDLLEHGKLLGVHGLLPWGSNYTFLASIAHNDLVALAIYKPRRGERPLWDFPDGTLCRREVAAFAVSEALGWHFVPPTVLRDGPQGIGMVQYYVEHDPAEHYFTLTQDSQHRPQLQRIALFDYIINNADRKGGHCLLDSQATIWAIDHGVSFHQEMKLRSVIWEFSGEPIPPELLQGVESLIDKMKTDELSKTLHDLLDDREVAAVRKRARLLCEKGTFPEPGPGISYPWPPV
jgi:uncharacterized repeat protein (TIGR03843 family)